MTLKDAEKAMEQLPGDGGYLSIQLEHTRSHGEWNTSFTVWDGTRHHKAHLLKHAVSNAVDTAVNADQNAEALVAEAQTSKA